MESKIRRDICCVPFTNVKIEDSFWKPKLEKHRKVTLPVCIRQLGQTGVIANFMKTAGELKDGHEGLYFSDSDVYKVLEGLAYSLMNSPDEELERTADKIIDKIAAAQHEDGYLSTYYTLAEPGKRWTNMSMHETYCAGHLIEAAVAYFNATGKDKLLGVAVRFADHLYEMFGEGKRHWVTGHQEIELALVKLFKTTGEKKYLELAQFFVDERGHGHGVGDIWDEGDHGPAYCQDDVPIREMSHAKGHATRAMYFYSAVADLAAITGDTGYSAALKRIWHSVVYKNMYITGSIGASNLNEGFTKDYDMPNSRSYCETCASIGMVYWNHRMCLLNADGRYADILEKALYNGVISGVSLEGNKFFYSNPLESNGSRRRRDWFECSCCPTSLARFIPTIGSYVYMALKDEIWVNLYIAGKADIKLGGGTVNLVQNTAYPWDGRVDITLKEMDTSLRCINLRLPGWCRSFSVFINGSHADGIRAAKGYITLEQGWKAGDVVTLQLDMPVERVYANPKVEADVGKVAIQRGPVVYCAEEADNTINYEKLCIQDDTRFLVKRDNDLLGGVTVITAINSDGNNAVLIPYYAIDNREPGKLKVWLNEEIIQDSLYSTTGRFPPG